MMYLMRYLETVQLKSEKDMKLLQKLINWHLSNIRMLNLDQPESNEMKVHCLFLPATQKHKILWRPGGIEASNITVKHNWFKEVNKLWEGSCARSVIVQEE